MDYVSRKYKVSLRVLTEEYGVFLANHPSPQEYFLQLKDKLIEMNQRFGGWLMVDADWFGRERCLLLYKDHPSGRVLLWRLADREYKILIYQDLAFLVSQGYPLRGITSDWKGSIVAAVDELALRLRKNLPHQRCLVHVQLSAQRFLTKNPKTEPGKQLLEMAQLLNSVKSEYEQNIWLRWLERWGERHQAFTKERTYSEDKDHWWYTHKNARRVFRSINKDKEPLFAYLRSSLPKDTNGLEGVFSQLDAKLARHRGLNQEKKEALIAWFFFLREFPKVKFRNKNLGTNTHT